MGGRKKIILPGRYFGPCFIDEEIEVHGLAPDGCKAQATNRASWFYPHPNHVPPGPLSYSLHFRSVEAAKKPLSQRWL